MAKKTPPYLKAVRRILDGKRSVESLRAEYGSGLHFAVDNDVVMSYVQPRGKQVDPIKALFVREGDFSVDDQAISLSERLGNFVLQHICQDSGNSVYSLPGHHTELWEFLAADIHSKLAEELTSFGKSALIRKQVLDFRDTFYAASLRGTPPTLNELIQAVPTQMWSWLGLGEASMQWARLQRLHSGKLLKPFPLNMVEADFSIDEDRTKHFQDLVASREKWEGRLWEAHKRWSRESELYPSLQRAVRSDAVALAYLEKFNRSNSAFGAAGKRLVLVTGSDRILQSVWGLSASEFGGPTEDPAYSYFVHPIDFLDECHLQLSGKATTRGADEGRFSLALKLIAKAESPEQHSQAVSDFSEIWGKFLRTCVLERIQSRDLPRRTSLNRVLFVFKKAGLSSDIPGNDLTLELAERGSELLIEAADVRLNAMRLLKFSRGAPYLRLDKHPLAEKVQLKNARTFCRLIGRPRVRNSLILEANHRYTLHLLQARAFIWAGDWKTGLQLCNFALSISDKLKPADAKMVPDVDGREAAFLAAHCERFAGKASPASLRKSIERLDEFKRLANLAFEGDGMTTSDLALHHLRYSSELQGINTTAVLAVTFSVLYPASPWNSSSVWESIDVPALLDRLKELRDTARSLLDITMGSTKELANAICARVFEQAWLNEVQLRLLLASDRTKTTLSILIERRNEWQQYLTGINCKYLGERVYESSQFVKLVPRLLRFLLDPKEPEVLEAIRDSITEDKSSLSQLGFFYEEQKLSRLFEVVANPDRFFPSS